MGKIKKVPATPTTQCQNPDCAIQPILNHSRCQKHVPCRRQNQFVPEACEICALALSDLKGNSERERKEATLLLKGTWNAIAAHVSLQCHRIPSFRDPELRRLLGMPSPVVKGKGAPQSSSATSAITRVDPTRETPKRKRHKTHKSSKKAKKDLPSTSKMTLREVQDLMVQQGFGHHFRPCPTTPGNSSPENPHSRCPSLQRDPSPEVFLAPVLQILSLPGPDVTEARAEEQTLPKDQHYSDQEELTELVSPNTILQELLTVPKLDLNFADKSQHLCPSSPESVLSANQARAESVHSVKQPLPETEQFVKLADLENKIQSTVQSALGKQIQPMFALMKKMWDKANDTTLTVPLVPTDLSDVSGQDSPTPDTPNKVEETPIVTPPQMLEKLGSRSPSENSEVRPVPTSIVNMLPETAPQQSRQDLVRSPPLLQEQPPLSAFDPSSLYGEGDDWYAIEAIAPEEFGVSNLEENPVDGTWTIQTNQQGDLRALDVNGQLLQAVIKAVPSASEPRFFVWMAQTLTDHQFKKAPWYDYASTDIYKSAKKISALTKEKIFIPTTIDEGKPALILPTLKPGPWISWFEDGELFASRCALSLAALSPVPKQKFGDCRVAQCQPLPKEVSDFLNAPRIVLKTIDNKWFPGVDAKYLDKDFRHRQRAARMVATLQVNMALGQAMDNLKQIIDEGTPQLLCTHIKQLHLANAIQGVEDTQSAVFEAVRTRQILRWAFVKFWPEHIQTKVMQSTVFTAPLMDTKIWSVVYWELKSLDPPRSPTPQQSQDSQSSKGKQLLHRPQPSKGYRARENIQLPSHNYHSTERKELVASQPARRPSPEQNLSRHERRFVPQHRSQYSKPWYYDRHYYH